MKYMLLTYFEEKACLSEAERQDCYRESFSVEVQTL